MSELTQFILASDRVVEFQAYFASIPEADHTVHTLEVQKDEIVHLWSSLRSSYDLLLSSVESSEEEIDVESIKAKFFTAFNSHMKCLSKANELVDKLSYKPTIANDNAVSAPNPTISLPPCDTEVFYGDYASWPTLRDMFSALYKNNTRLSPVEKLCHLLKKTQGEARAILKTCPLTNDGFEMAWKNLIERYENPRVLINAQLKTIFSLTAITRESGSSIKTLQRTINDCIANLKVLKVKTDDWDIIFVYLCSTCLPHLTLNLWEQSLQQNSTLPKWSDMDSFLTSRFHVLESVADIKSSTTASSESAKPVTPKHSQGQGNKRLNTYHTKMATEAKQCSLCNEPHPLRLCPKFLKMYVEDRFSLVKSQKRCTNCLATSHEFNKCKSKFVCSYCNKKHHSLLHRTETSGGQHNRQSGTSNTTALEAATAGPNDVNAASYTDNIPSSSTAGPRYHQSYSTQLQSTLCQSTILGTAFVDVCVGSVRYRVRALIDPASEASFISRPLQKKLVLPVRYSKTGVMGLNGSLTATSTHICPITVGSPLDIKFQTEVDMFVVSKLTGQLEYKPYLPLIKSHFADLHMADWSEHDRHIDILLGGDVYPQIIRDGVRWTPDKLLVAQQTIFGWIVTGKVAVKPTSHTVTTFYNEIALNDQIRKFWELEEIPEKVHMSKEDLYCEKLYRDTTFRNASGRFVVSLPFKQEYPAHINLGKSRNIALSQFLRNEKRLCRNPPNKDKYDKVILEYLSLGHMTEVNPISSENSCTYYLPHHAVLKPESTTTKLRVVFNASCPSSNGISLNDVLYPGPVLQADLTILLLRWRLFEFVFNADIEKMYRQILVSPKHTPFQRILHRSNPHEEPKDYELNTVTFGVNCAPYLAIRTLLELASQCEPINPAVSDILRNYMYVDDVLWGSHDLSQAIEIQQQLVNVLNSAGFSLRKWTANNELILQNIPPEHRLDAEFLKLSDLSTTKTLGLRWNAGQDYFYFRPNINPKINLTTKRAILSEIAKLFDPAGWLAPKVIVAKIIMQQIWKDGTDWDDTVEPATLCQWQNFIDDYPNIEKISIPRFVDYNPTFITELHGFCDASEKAYAATLYIRVKTPNGEINTHLLAAKSKVAPVKFVTLPRKELCGADLLSKMVTTFQAELKLQSHKLYLWTDSTIVLAWLQKPPCHWTTFVANRVASIIENVGNSTWSHVSSEDNPADLASRGLSAEELVANDLWWKGPPWLKLPSAAWPICPSDLETQEEARPIKSFVNQLPESDILSLFSDLPRAMRVLSYAFRFLHRTHPNHRSNTQYTSKALSQAEVNFVKTRLIILCQKRYLPEYDILSQGLRLPRKSDLLALNPYIDPQGIIRVNGRLAKSPLLSFDERYPKILPYSGRFTRLYLETIHKYSLHAENALMLRLMRNEFWVPRLKNLIKTIIFNCKRCAILKHQQSQQLMAALPSERTELSRPFTNTGVDFAGPFDIKSYVGRGCKVTKGYVLVLVCFATKAIHLELTSELSTQAFMAAFARFFSRRGTPKAIYSDNGTGFVGAANIISRDQSKILHLVQQHIISQYAFQSVEWHFIPPGAPHMGGLWEAGVKSFKTHLKKITHALKFTFEEFSTMLARIEACLNSRPLSAMSENPEELCALTPGHFLIGTPLLTPAEPDCSQNSVSFANRWQKLKILHHYFAIRWKEEYLKELHKRVKWKYPQRDLQVNDLVVVKRDNLPPTQWLLGRVEKTVLGSDSRVRVAEVRTRNGLIVRPIVKLVLLPNSDQ